MEAELQKLFHDRTAQLQDAENNAATSIKSIQDIVAAKVVSLNKELIELRVCSSQFLQKWDQTEQERCQLADSLHEHQINSVLELERQREQYLKKSTDSTNRLLRQFDQLIAETETRITALNKSSKPNYSARRKKLKARRPHSKPSTRFMRNDSTPWWLNNDRSSTGRSKRLSLVAGRNGRLNLLNSRCYGLTLRI